MLGEHVTRLPNQLAGESRTCWETEKIIPVKSQNYFVNIFDKRVETGEEAVECARTR